MIENNSFKDLLDIMFAYLFQLDIIRLQLVSQKMRKASKKYIKTTHFMQIESKLDLYEAFKRKMAITINRLNVCKYESISSEQKYCYHEEDKLQINCCKDAIRCGLFASGDRDWIKVCNVPMFFDEYALSAIIANDHFFKFVEDIYNKSYPQMTTDIFPRKFEDILFNAIKYNKIDIVIDILNRADRRQLLMPISNKITDAIFNDRLDIFRLLVEYFIADDRVKYDGNYISYNSRYYATDCKIKLKECFRIACGNKRYHYFDYLLSLMTNPEFCCKNCDKPFNEHHPEDNEEDIEMQ